jgi:hypothetical protein
MLSHNINSLHLINRRASITRRSSRRNNTLRTRQRRLFIYSIISTPPSLS